MPEKDINNDQLKNFDIVIFTNYYNLENLIQFNKFCRSQVKPIGFIFCGILGLYNFVFEDFGEGFKVYDANGDEPLPLLIENIKKASPGIVTVNKEKPHNY
jgi:ubiquitin-activating enzyme E1